MELIIFGSGGYGQPVADVAEQLGYEVSFLDDNSDKAMDTCANFAQYIGDDTPTSIPPLAIMIAG